VRNSQHDALYEVLATGLVKWQPQKAIGGAARTALEFQVDGQPVGVHNSRWAELMRARKQDVGAEALKDQLLAKKNAAGRPEKISWSKVVGQIVRQRTGAAYKVLLVLDIMLIPSDA